MVDEQDKPHADNVYLVRRLVNETDITEAQAHELIGFLGPNWSSLVREARLLKRP
jgi:hypothetical protein